MVGCAPPELRWKPEMGGRGGVIPESGLLAVGLLGYLLEETLTGEPGRVCPGPQVLTLLTCCPGRPFWAARCSVVRGPGHCCSQLLGLGP